jgi:hypothetical protein
MNRADRKAWYSARTFGDLCELTARWIEGDPGEQPAYYGPSDIEDPEMVPVLAALNRAGFMTTCSQAGMSGPGYDEAGWEQCAAVEGFADAATARRLVGIAGTGGMTVVIHEPPPRWSRRVRYDEAVTVTWRAGHPYTHFGARVPVRDLRDAHVGYGNCHGDAVKALCDAWQVAVIDPEPGRRWLLWAVLSVFAGSAA